MPSIAGHGESSISHPRAAKACSGLAICSRVSSLVVAQKPLELRALRRLGVVVEHLEHTVLHLQPRAEQL